VFIVVWMDNGHKTAVKRNDDDRWSSDDMVIWIGGGKIETRLSDGKSDQD
jgi:major membrane immunogen (membrane-anchored lipoprotein)